jgi:uncharacterized protein YacL
MKQWSAAEWSMIILSSTVPLSIIGLIVMRLMTGQPLSENAGGVINNVLNIVGGGVIGIIAMNLSKKKDEPTI